MKHKRCMFYIKDRETKKIRKCKNNSVHDLLCVKHSKNITNIKNIRNIDQEKSIYDELGYGSCCFCHGECNPLSQACGRCLRNL